MSNLYGNKLAKVYDSTYQGFIDYGMEYKFYATICNEFKARTILEIACGSGNLAEPFTNSYEDYLGIDYSRHMLKLAREKYPKGNFMQGDMREISLSKKYEAALITGRSTSYLLSDQDLDRAFSSVSNALKAPALFVFDCIDAEKFIPYVGQNPEVTHTSIIEDVLYLRETKWFLKKGPTNNLVDWSSTYFKESKGKKRLLGSDDTLFRVFRREELETYLENNGFKIVRVIDRKTYAFDTFVVVAQKKM